MRPRLSRRWFSERSTIGQLYVDDVEECFTLEDMVRRDPDPATSANEAIKPISAGVSNRGPFDCQ